MRILTSCTHYWQIGTLVPCRILLVSCAKKTLQRSASRREHNKCSRHKKALVHDEPGFPRGGNTNLFFWRYFPKIYMNIKNVLRECVPSTLDPPIKNALWAPLWIHFLRFTLWNYVIGLYHILIRKAWPNCSWKFTTLFRLERVVADTVYQTIESEKFDFNQFYHQLSWFFLN